MTKKDLIISGTILVIILILLLFGYQDYKRQQRIAIDQTGSVIDKQDFNILEV